jgi:hypothetical protein
MTAAMHKRLILLGLFAAAAILSLSSVAAEAQVVKPLPGHAGDIVYVAEHLKHLLPTGSHVRAGQQIADALPGGTGTEWGWADADGATRADTCYHEGEQTASGKEMGAFHEISWGRRSRPPGSRTRCAVRKALLTDGT